MNTSLVQSRLLPIFRKALVIFLWYSTFQPWASSTNFVLPTSHLVCCFIFQSIFSTTFCVAKNTLGVVRSYRSTSGEYLTGVVTARQPQRSLSLLPAIADQQVLQRVAQGVAHAAHVSDLLRSRMHKQEGLLQGSCDAWRRYDDDKLALGLDLAS